MSASILLPTVVWPSNRRGLDALHMEILSYITAIKKGQNLVQRGQISCKWKWSTNWFNNWMFFLHNLTNRIIFANEVQTDLIQELTKILEHSFCEWSTNWFDNCLVTAINQELRVFFFCEWGTNWFLNQRTSILQDDPTLKQVSFFQVFYFFKEYFLFGD